MLKRWKGAVDNSKVFDCFSLELIIVTLNAYDLSLAALTLIHDGLSNRKQRAKINHDFS